MARNSLKVALGLVVLALVLVFGSKDGAAQLDAHGSSAPPIYPAGGTDGPPA